MADRADVEVVEAIYAAMAARDLGALPRLIAPDLVLTQDARLPWGGRFEGHDGFTEFAIALTGAISSVVETEAFFATDTEVVQMGRTRGTVVATGAAFDIPEVHRWTVRDGRGRTAHLSIDTDAMLAVLAEG